MAQEDIVNAILSDAEKEAQEIIANAQRKAEETRKAAQNVADTLLRTAEAETQARAKAIADGKAATARLDCAKITLAEKRRVIASVYARAHEKLETLGEKEALSLLERLLKNYAQEGDEVVIGKRFIHRAAFEKLPVVSKLKLKVVTDASVSGGFILRGKNADVDLSFATLLAQDREEHQSEIAAELFK